MGSDTVVIFGIRFEYPAQMRSPRTMMWSTHLRRIDPIRDMPNLPQYPGITTNIRNTRCVPKTYPS